MKWVIYMAFYCLMTASYGQAQAQQLSDFVQHRLDSIRKKTKNSLNKYRVWDNDVNGDMTRPYSVGFLFSNEEIILIDSLGLKINVGMLYDDAMRDRIVQLLRNEYQDWELDSLVNRSIRFGEDIYINRAMETCKFDTMQIFIEALDTFYLDIKYREGTIYSKNMYKYDVFKLLKLDTTQLFKQTYAKIVDMERKREREELLNSKSYDRDYIYLAVLCGYIGDKRFVQPIIEMLNRVEDYQKERIIEALARMRVEPYYTDYVKERTLTMEQIQDKNRLKFRLSDFVDVLGTQEAFLELSKYLLSDKPYITEIRDYDDHSESVDYPVSQNAFYLIKNHIENADLQKITNTKHVSDNPEILQSVYDWMQKNYGKYKIERFW